MSYEGSYELDEATLEDGTILDDHLSAMGGWIASTLVKLGDLKLPFLPPVEEELVTARRCRPRDRRVYRGVELTLDPREACESFCGHRVDIPHNRPTIPDARCRGFAQNATPGSLDPDGRTHRFAADGNERTGGRKSCAGEPDNLQLLRR